MKQENAIHITTVANLEVGDLFVYETLGSLASGVVEEVVYTTRELTDLGRDYVKNKGSWELSDDPYEPVVGASQKLVIYRAAHWWDPNRNGREHICLEFDAQVVVFEYDHKYTKSFTDTPDCGE